MHDRVDLDLAATAVGPLPRLEALITTWVHVAPDIQPALVEAAAAAALAVATRRLGEPTVALLALAIERAIDDIAHGDISQAIGLPAIAMAAAALASRGPSHAATEAARFELETMFPIRATGKFPAPADLGDVPVSRLRRGPDASTPAPRTDHAAVARARRVVGVPQPLLTLRDRYQR